MPSWVSRAWSNNAGRNRGDGPPGRGDRPGTRLVGHPLQGGRQPTGGKDRRHPAAAAVRPVWFPWPPAGEEGGKKLAELLGVEPKPLDETHGTPKPKSVAFIDENTCIGCTLCIQACPVDAISGAAKQMHTIIAAECTGCELCLPPCPVDCISMVPIAEDLPHWKWKHPVVMMKQIAETEDTRAANCSGSRAACIPPNTRRNPRRARFMPHRCRRNWSFPCASTSAIRPSRWSRSASGS